MLLKVAVASLLLAIVLLALQLREMRAMRDGMRDIERSQRLVAERVDRLIPAQEGKLVASYTWTSGGVTREWVHVEKQDNETSAAFATRANSEFLAGLAAHPED